MKLAFTGLVFGALLQACVIVPLPTESEYSEEKLAQLKIGTTTRQQVYEVFGTPHMLDPQGPGVLFSDVRTTAFFATAYGSGTAKANDSLYVEFDNEDILSHLEEFEFDDMKECLSNRICMIRNPRTIAVNAVVFLRPSQDDRVAKEFSAQGESCSVYLFGDVSLDESKSVKAWHRVFLDTELVGTLHSPDNFMHLALTPGEHQIAAPPAIMWGTGGSAPGGGCFICPRDEEKEIEPANLAIDCKSGGMHFLQLIERTKSKGMFEVRYNPVELHLKPVPEEIGKSIILERDLVSSVPTLGTSSQNEE